MTNKGPKSLKAAKITSSPYKLSLEESEKRKAEKQRKKEPEEFNIDSEESLPENEIGAPRPDNDDAVVAGPYQDHLCLAVAKQLQKTFGGWVPPFPGTSRQQELSGKSLQKSRSLPSQDLSESKSLQSKGLKGSKSLPFQGPQESKSLRFQGLQENKSFPSKGPQESKSLLSRTR
uniref:Uncharacterized protein n=1 Tax=Timema genevievae TaxID=629358 RepID=A0A7R9JWR9_TIMGE|nr:unnamed protein product [Timema genevievae]